MENQIHLTAEAEAHLKQHYRRPQKQQSIVSPASFSHRGLSSVGLIVEEEIIATSLLFDILWINEE